MKPVRASTVGLLPSLFAFVTTASEDSGPCQPGGGGTPQLSQYRLVPSTAIWRALVSGMNVFCDGGAVPSTTCGCEVQPATASEAQRSVVRVMRGLPERCIAVVA